MIKYVVLFFLLLVVLFSIPLVQSELAKVVTKRINKDFGTNLLIKKVDFTMLGNVQLKGVEIRDHHQDTLIFVKKMKTSLLNAKKILDNQVDLNTISLEGVHFYMKTYKGEEDDNLAIFIDSFDSGKPIDSTKAPFILRAFNVYVEDLNYKLIDENKKNQLSFAAYNAGGNFQDLEVIGPNFITQVKGLYFIDNRGVEVTNLTTDFTYSRTKMLFENTTLQTANSRLKADIVFRFKREDLSEFIDKVKVSANFKKSDISIKDVKKLYSELSGNDLLTFTTKLKGTLNNFKLNKLNLVSKDGLKIKGDLVFKNAISTEKGFVFEGDLENVTASYKQLKNNLPNVLGKTLPSEFARLGIFTLSGITKITEKDIDATLRIQSAIGTVVSDLQLTNIDDIDTAEYSGEIALNEFDLGAFINSPILGKVSLKGDVNGSGFILENVNTTFIGEASKLVFKGYAYQNLRINGQLKNRLFDGDLLVNDTYLKMNFKGLADLSSLEHTYDFKADIFYLNLKETNLYIRDSLSILKGRVNIDIKGNTLDNIVGKATISEMSYENQKKTYLFQKLTILSAINDRIKTIKVISKDVVNGELKGDFTFKDLLPITQNSLGNIYTNYEPIKVKPHQFLNFNFTIYNQIVDVLFPGVSIDDNTKIRGRIKADNNQLKLTVTSPKIVAFKNEIRNLLLRTDTKNPLYNTHITASKIETEFYTISKLNLLNRTVNDTLFFKSIFKGGTENKENFNLDFFYTINQDKKSVVGIQKSTFNYQGNNWEINPKGNKLNKVSFDLAANHFDFSLFNLKSKEQEIIFKGSLKDSLYKDLEIDFKQVKLSSFLPKIDSLDLQGTLTGAVIFIQKDTLYSPKGTLMIHDFVINNFKQGDLALNVQGDNSYKKYSVDVSLKREEAKSIAAIGTIDFSTSKPAIDLEVFLEDFKLNAFSPLGSDVLSKIRGNASGNFTLKGFLGNPEMTGSLLLREAGLYFPYLNVDYDFGKESSITLQEQSFILDDIQLEDIKHKTKGRLLGSITHRNFESWVLNLQINTDNLLVLDTEEAEESLYFGTAFIKGNASITGLTDNLDININATTQPGTIFVLPLKDIKTVENYQLIHFKTENKLDALARRKHELKAVSGLSLKIVLEVTKDAKAQVVIDKEFGSQLSGSGSGTLDIRIDTRGEFNMFGDFVIDKGVYDFKYGGIVNKPFEIQKGGTISWSGSPFDANLNLKAIYKTKANPAVLLENFNTNRNIPIDLETKITGGLFSSKQELDIKLPNVDPAIATELEFVINDNDVNQKTTQFISLLIAGRFINPDKVSFDSDAAISGVASSAIAAAFSSLLNSKDGKFQLGVDYKQGNRNDIENVYIDDQVDFSFNTKVSDRVIVNGKVGVPIGSKVQSSVVGEVNVEILLNKVGSLRLVIFNKQNEIQYSTEEEGYTQGVGVSYQVNFNSLSELFRKITKKKKRKKSIKKDTIKSSKNKLVHFN